MRVDTVSMILMSMMVRCNKQTTVSHGPTVLGGLYCLRMAC